MTRRLTQDELRAAMTALTPSDAEALVNAWWANEKQLARDDVNVFAELCFKDDQTAGSPPFRQQWFHREWQQAWCTQPVAVIHGATGFGKTDNVIAHLIWRIGRKPNIRILIVGNSEDKAKELSAKIKRQIESNELVRAVFPHLRPGEPWGVESFRVAGAGIDTTTNTVTIYGIDKPKAGPRADIVLLDDVNDEENTRTRDRREALIRMVDSVIQSRLTTEGQLFILANAWHPEDLAFTYSKRPRIWYRAYPAWDDMGRLLWPSFRPREWLEAKRDTMTPTEFARMFLCRPRDESTRVFQSDWFALARRRGAGLRPVRMVEHLLDRTGQLIDPRNLDSLWQIQTTEMRVIVGVDLATGKTERKRKTDFTVLFTIGVRPDGCRQVLWIEKRRIPAPQTLRALKDHEARYQPVRFVVEDNGSQVFLAQFAREQGALETPIEDFNTTGKKWDPALGIEGIGVELEAGRWLLPGPADGETEKSYRASLAPDELEAYDLICEWSQNLLDFSRQGHTADDVSASYLAQQGALRMAAGVFGHRDIPPDPAQRAAGNWGTVQALFPPLAQQPAPTEAPDAVRRLLGL